MDDGSALIHINGVEYQLVGQYDDPNGPAFQGLVARIERLVKGVDTQVQRFEVNIGGHDGQLMVRPSDLVSAAVVFVPGMPEVQAF